MENIIQQIALDLVEKITKKLLKQKFLIWFSVCMKFFEPLAVSRPLQSR